MEKLRICFIGTGSMGSAVLQGLVASGYDKKLISATTRSEASAAKLREQGISALAIETSADANQLLASDAQLIVLGVKPYQIADVLTEIREEIDKEAVVISMAAGIELKTMAEKLPKQKNLIRTMPNTPALVGKGVTGLVGAQSASKDAIEAAIALFETVGEVVEIEESQINALSAISGSGPAWLMFIVEKWEEVAISKGFTSEQAAKLVRSTLIGSAELLATTGDEPALIRKNVTSPGGTTERIIATLDAGKLNELFDSALEAAVKRAHEIASSNS
ncbi:MAG: pyrroline-5-carboxylate reductase [Aquiluna sp.]